MYEGVCFGYLEVEARLVDRLTTRALRVGYDFRCTHFVCVFDFGMRSVNLPRRLYQWIMGSGNVGINSARLWRFGCS